MSRPPPKPEDLAPRKRAAVNAPRPPGQPAVSAGVSDRLVPAWDEIPRAPRTKLRKFGKFIVILVLAAAAWTAWAAAAFYDLHSGLESSDAVALERRIDWLRVRDGLRDDLLAGRATGGAVQDAARVDPMLSRAAVGNLLRTATLNERGWDSAGSVDKQSVFGWYRVRSALFSGGPFAFRVEISPASDKAKRPFILLFQWTGDWRLTRVFLPGDAAISPVAAAQPQAALASAQTATPPSTPAATTASATRAVLYEEDPADPNGRQSTGSVNWRAEPAAAGSAEQAIVADISIPERALGLTVTIRRNLDKSLPASHTIEMKFTLPADQPERGISDVAAIQMKPSEEAAGQPLAGSRVKISKDFFLMGLSAIDLDVQANMQLLKGRAWLGILFASNNKNRAVLAVEKGEAGTRIIADTLERWSATPVAGNTAAR